MEAPEKIYFSQIENGTHYYTEEIPFERDYIEYVGKKAFIEKACDWLKSNITNNPNANSVLARNGCVTLGMMIEDFKKYMEE